MSFQDDFINKLDERMLYFPGCRQAIQKFGNDEKRCRNPYENVQTTCFLIHHEIKIGIREWFFLKCKMPPFFGERTKPMSDHGFTEEHSVGKLF